MFAPNEPHQLINNGEEDLVMYVVADNPIGESGYYPDSKKWIVPMSRARDSAFESARLFRRGGIDGYEACDRA